MKWVIGPLSAVILIALGLPGVKGEPAWLSFVWSLIISGLPFAIFGLAGAFCFAHGLMGVIAAWFMSRQADRVRAFSRVLSLFAKLFALTVFGSGVLVSATLPGRELKVALMLALNMLVVPLVVFLAQQLFIDRRPGLVAFFHGARLASDVLTASWMIVLIAISADQGEPVGMAGYAVLASAAAMGFLDALGLAHKP